MAESTSYVYQQNIPEEIFPYAQKLLDQAQAFTDVSKYPFQQYQGERVAQLAPLTKQAMESAGQLGVAGQIGAATDLAATAGLGALSAQYDPNRFYTGSFANPFTAGRYMSPYMQDVVGVQQREAKRQADIASTARGAQAARAGAFGGSRFAIENAEANRALQSQLGNIQAQGLQNAFQQAQAQFNAEDARRLQAQQLSEQSRQFGAGYGLQGLQAALQSAQTLGGLGTQQAAQTQQAIQTQAALGQQEQQQAQNILNAQYQDYLNYQNYPYKMLGFMSDIIRGVPTAQSAASIYQAPPSPMSQLTGLGVAGLGLSKLGVFKKGGKVNEAPAGLAELAIYNMG